MTDTGDLRHRRVRVLLEAAADLRDASHPLGREARARLPSVTGLSPEGVERAFASSWEISASDAELERLVSRAGEAPRVHVVLSANVFVGVVRALSLAVAAAPVVAVRPSRREPVLVPLLRKAIATREEQTGVPLGIRQVDSIEPRQGDVVHAYGRAESLAAIAKSLPAGVGLWAHGPGLGIALLEGPRATDDELAARAMAQQAAERLADDIVLFDQHGCLSPRVLLVGGNLPWVQAFLGDLSAALDRRGRDVPRGALSEEERTSLALYRATMRAVGVFREGASFGVGFDPSPVSLLVPPTGRHLHVAWCPEGGQLPGLLLPLLPLVTTIGSYGEGPLRPRLLALCPKARLAELGQMQRPPLDGPVDLRT